MCSFFFRRTPLDYYEWKLEERKCVDFGASKT